MEIRNEHFITDYYQDMWDKADELAKKEVTDKGLIVARRDKHLEVMVDMFISMIELLMKRK
jgi:hypothetical protein